MKTITVNQMNAFVKCHESGYRYAKIADFTDEMEIVLDTELSFDDIVTFVDRVAGSVVHGSEYEPCLFDVMFFATSLQMMSNVNVPTKNSDIDGETIKVLDLKKLQEWLYCLGESFDAAVEGNPNLNHLQYLVRQKISFLQAKMKNETPMQEFFAKAIKAIDHMGDTHGIDMAEMVQMMTPQIRSGGDTVLSNDVVPLAVSYDKDGTMMI